MSSEVNDSYSYAIYKKNPLIQLSKFEFDYSSSSGILKSSVWTKLKS
jgi:hypothetical protein